MNDNPQAPDFDWVTAREQCSLEREFALLERLVKQNYETKKGFLRKNHPVCFLFTKNSEREFHVSREPKDEIGNIYTVIFERRNDHIYINNLCEEFEVAVELNDKGECCLRILGEGGEYLRWQIARRVLAPLFFEGPDL